MSISDSGRFVAFASSLYDDNGEFDVYVRDLKTNRLRRVSLGKVKTTQRSINGKISGNGRFVVFESAERTFVPGDTNGVTDVFVRDLVTGTMERASIGMFGNQLTSNSSDPDISADGRFIKIFLERPGISARSTLRHDEGHGYKLSRQVSCGGVEYPER